MYNRANSESLTNYSHIIPKTSNNNYAQLGMIRRVGSTESINTTTTSSTWYEKINADVYRQDPHLVGINQSDENGATKKCDIVESVQTYLSARNNSVESLGPPLQRANSEDNLSVFSEMLYDPVQVVATSNEPVVKPHALVMARPAVVMEDQRGTLGHVYDNAMGDEGELYESIAGSIENLAKQKINGGALSKHGRRYMRSNIKNNDDNNASSLVSLYASQTSLRYEWPVL